MLQVGHLRLVEWLDQIGIGDAVAIQRADAGDVLGAMRQLLLGVQLGDARDLVADVLDDVDAGRLQDRVVDVLAQQPRIVAAPGADDALFRRPRAP